MQKTLCGGLKACGKPRWKTRAAWLCAWLLMGPAWAQHDGVQSSTNTSEFEIIPRIFEGQFHGASICLSVMEVGPYATAQFWPRQGACDWNAYLDFGGKYPDGGGFLDTNEKNPQSTEWSGSKFNGAGPAISLTWTLQEMPADGASPAALAGQSRSQWLGDSGSVVKEEIEDLHFEQTARHPFFDNLAYRIALVLDQTSEEGQIITKAIRLYDGARLVQELSADSRNDVESGPYLPDVIDLNFDGHEDMMLEMMPPVSPSISYQYWLYNPQTGLFEVAPESLQEVSSLEVDAQHQQIYSFWRASAMSHGISIYQWEMVHGQQEAVLKKELYSYELPIRDHGQLYYCYQVPTYDPASGSAVFTGMVIRQADGSYGYLGEGINVDGCGSTYVYTPRLDIWEDQPDGLSMFQTLYADWVPAEIDGRTQWALEIPYFDLQSHEIGWYVDRSNLLDEKP